MSDIAFDLLREKLNDLTAFDGVWVVDENISFEEIRQIHPRNNLLAVTNRYDVYTQLLAHGLRAEISDFDFSNIAPLDVLFFRVSKEKAIVHHIINGALLRLRENGRLFLSGYKNEGIKTYINKTASLFDNEPTTDNGGKTARIACLQKPVATGSLLDDKNYDQIVDITEVGGNAETIKLATKPGVFGWNKIDKGSAFLIEHLSLFLDDLAGRPKVIADLGCGYGYLSVMASQTVGVEFIATDNNVTAVTCCRENFKRYAISGEVILDDCAEGFRKKVDVVLCNPPFHQGFDVDGDLTSRFLTAAKKLLRENGAALFVVNSFIPLERKAEGIFSKVSVLANNRSFKLLALEP